METGEPVLNTQFTGTTAAQPDIPRTWISQWSPLKCAEEKILGINVVAEEITERKRAEEALRQALTRAEEGDRLLSALMEYVPGGITVTDAALNLIRVSRYGQELLGGPHEGKSISDVAGQWKVYHADGITPMAFEDLPLVRAVQCG
jgi:PAS domain-containing protein